MIEILINFFVFNEHIPSKLAGDLKDILMLPYLGLSLFVINIAFSASLRYPTLLFLLLV